MPNRLLKIFQPVNLPKLRSLLELGILVRKCIAESEAVVGKAPAGLRFKPMKSQWGSCNSVGIIALNAQLSLDVELNAFKRVNQMVYLRHVFLRLG